MTATRERAINLRDWEVKAIQAGRLKMLVRPVKPQPYRDTEMRHTMFVGGTVWVRNSKLKADWAHAVKNPESMIQFCPYGKPGDRLRGREAAAINDTGRPAARYHFNAHVKYKADGLNLNFDVDLKHWRTAFENNALRYQSSIHMPRWAVRNWLEITEVRCGRVREMSHRDMLFAGWPDHDKLCGGEPTGTHWDYVTKGDWINAIGDGDDGCVEWFADQYDADHGEGAWERDWVWMIGVNMPRLNRTVYSTAAKAEVDPEKFRHEQEVLAQLRAARESLK